MKKKRVYKELGYKNISFIIIKTSGQKFQQNKMETRSFGEHTEQQQMH